MPRLVETKDLSYHPVYMTLSHCWGKQKYTCLTKDNKDSMKTQVPADAISKTFAEAMQTAKQFGVSYIWIDSLCIMQSNTQDWQTESLRMADVYKGAVCNLAASAAKDGREGLYSPRSDATTVPCKIEITQPGNEDKKWKVYLVDSQLWMGRVTESVIGKRAWVIQERYLAQRMIHFAYDQVLWECRENRSCEIFPNSLPEAIQTTSTTQLIPGLDKTSSLVRFWDQVDLSQAQALAIWEVFVAEYTAANLTDETDKLVAVAGLAKSIEKAMNCRYLAGLWENELLTQLLWSVYGSYGAVRPKAYVAPTWSWASVCGKVLVRYPFLNKFTEENVKIVGEVVDVQVKGVTNDLMGQMKSGCLTVLGSLATTAISLGKDASNDPPSLKRQNVVGSTQQLAPTFVPDLADLIDGREVYCLPLLERLGDELQACILGLVLIRTDTGTGDTCFQRVGTFRQTKEDIFHDDAIGAFWSQCRGFPEQQKAEKRRPLIPTEVTKDGIPRYIIKIE